MKIDISKVKTNREDGKGEMARGKKDEGTIKDGRTAPIFIHSIIDDMTGLSPNTMRVYMHLARRADKSGSAWPSYQSIGDHCFGSVYQHPDGRRKHAVAAIAELIEAKLIHKEMRLNEHGQQTNMYILLDPVTVASQPAVTVESPPCDATVPPPVIVESLPPVTVASPKGIPVEDTPIEGTPIEEMNERMNECAPEDSFIHSPTDAQMELDDCVDLLTDPEVGLDEAKARELASVGFDCLLRQIFAWQAHRDEGGKYNTTGALINRIKSKFSAPALTAEQKRSALYERFHTSGYSGEQRLHREYGEAQSCLS